MEDQESRLQRIKLEAAVTEQHNSRLESQQENNSDKETCKTNEDSEVCNVCLKYHSQAPAGCWPVLVYLFIFGSWSHSTTQFAVY